MITTGCQSDPKFRFQQREDRKLFLNRPSLYTNIRTTVSLASQKMPRLGQASTGSSFNRGMFRTNRNMHLLIGMACGSLENQDANRWNDAITIIAASRSVLLPRLSFTRAVQSQTSGQSSEAHRPGGGIRRNAPAHPFSATSTLSGPASTFMARGNVAS